ncbi:hypothetical protein ABFT23_13245 [Nocardioides sp. C4-1]|uniref:hypothetical protein n=1 Tax=Nocardioides sp. C4-1 TaxID=3151851 RepID=UPI0032654BD9
MSNGLRSGPEAAAQVADDPFWSVVRRRHPDLDIVLLPPDDATGPPPDDAPAPLVEPAAEAARADGLADLWWRAVVVDEPTEATSRWVGGSARGTRRREVTRRLEGADLAATTAALDRARDRLVESGWHVLAPPGGMPRVLASHVDAGRRTELMLVLAPTVSRLVLRLRTPDVRWSDDAS